jgi:hypothetical protein
MRMFGMCERAIASKLRSLIVVSPRFTFTACASWMPMRAAAASSSSTSINGDVRHDGVALLCRDALAGFIRVLCLPNRAAYEPKHLVSRVTADIETVSPSQ